MYPQAKKRLAEEAPTLGLRGTMVKTANGRSWAGIGPDLSLSNDAARTR